MSYISIDISSLFAEAFGITEFRRTPRFPQAASAREAERGQILFPQANASQMPAEVYSYIGTPVMFPFTFLGGNYRRLNRGIVETVSLADWDLPYSTLVDFRRNKNISITPINGGNGSVKELYGFDDWQISIKGIIIPDKTDVETQLQRLLQFENLADSINVVGDYFKMLGIYQLDITDIELPQIKGKPYVRPFALTCISNEPVELVL